MVVSAINGEFEASIAPDGQAAEHALLAYTLGVKQIVVAVNKMDEKSVKFNPDRFNDIKTQVLTYLLRIGYKKKDICFCPVSALNGDNLVEDSENMVWNKGNTLLHCLENYRAPKKAIDKPLRLPLLEVYKIGGIGTVPLGRVATGILKIGDNIKFTPSNIVSQVRSMEMHYNKKTTAEPGDIVGFNVKGVSRSQLRRGYVGSNADDNPAHEC